MMELLLGIFFDFADCLADFWINRITRRRALTKKGKK